MDKHPKTNTMKRTERTALKVLLWNHFDHGADRNRLMDELTGFIEKHYAEVDLTNNQVLNELISEIKDSGGLKRWKQRLAYMIRGNEV
jgi:hypothetical protein